MAITLSITNIDPAATALNIYRSVGSPVSPTSPGTPYATIAPAASWTDTAVNNYNVYHYRVEAVSGSNKTIGDNQAIAYYPDTGPGSNTVRRGDWMSGWMDEVTPDNFITGTDFATWLQAQGVTFSSNNSAALAFWSKVVFQGKILMIPNVYIGTVSWMNLYNSGLIYGTNDTGTHPPVTNLVETNQRKTITIRGNTYIVRTMRSVADKTAQYTTASVVAADTTCENYQVRVRLSNDGGSPTGPTRYSDLPPGSVATLLANPATATTTNYASNGNAVGNNSVTGTYQWLPVLELAPGL